MSIHISGCKFLIHFTRNFFFLFYTPIFTKQTHQFIYFTHLFNKILIILQFFIILFLTTPLSHRPITTNDPSTPSHHHHHPTSIIKKNQPTQSETQSISNPFITHPTWNPLTIWSAWFDDRRGLCLMIWSAWLVIDVVQWSVAMDDRRGLMIGDQRGLMIYRRQVKDDWWQ